MSTFRALWGCMFAPRLIKVYVAGQLEKVYEPNALERWGDQVINSLYVIWRLGIYTSPLLAGLLYQRDYFTADGLVTLTKIATSIGVILVVSFCCRGLSRAQNPTYRNFIANLEAARSNLTKQSKSLISKYDFDFYAWPVDYSCKSAKTGLAPRKRIDLEALPEPRGPLAKVLNVPFNIIAYFAIHTFGIRFIYPGSFGLLQAMLEQAIIQGRSRLIQLYNGERFKVETIDNNEIDTIFLDRRNISPNGTTLVICCEGNAGFYEIGIAITPIEAGYSVLGWNHPGFGGSTGLPYPMQEQNAIDAVVQFAINKLGFAIENIVFFGWSIGGYSSSWAAMNYPEAKGIILDATFDDILPLAVHHMPSWIEPIVFLVIRKYANLNVHKQLIKYPGPIQIYRRSEDEVICIKDNDLSSNRGNYLLIKLLQHRYPFIVDQTQTQILHEYLSVTTNGQDEILAKFEVDENFCQSLLQSYISEYSKLYPMKIGEDYNSRDKTKMTLFLAKKYFKDFKATHCVNLPPDMFQMPWDLNVEAGFVYTGSKAF